MPTPASTASSAKPRAKRTGAASIPRENNRIHGKDVPLPWKTAALEGGFTERTFWRLLERREVAKIMIGGKAFVYPSEVAAYLKRQVIPAL